MEAIVAGCAAHKRRLRVVGSGLSPNGVGFSEEGMMSMALLDKVLWADPDSQLVSPGAVCVACMVWCIGWKGNPTPESRKTVWCSAPYWGSAASVWVSWRLNTGQHLQHLCVVTADCTCTAPLSCFGWAILVPGLAVLLSHTWVCCTSHTLSTCPSAKSHTAWHLHIFSLCLLGTCAPLH